MAEPSEIRFVYFDLGNVLVSFDPAIACANIAELFGISPSQAEAVVYASGLQDRFEHGEVSEDDYAETIRGHFDRTITEVSTAAILDAVSAMFTPVVAMRDVLAEVRDRGFRLGVLSNTCWAHWNWIARQRYPLMEGSFDATILSCEVGSMKPDAVIYEAAERAAARADVRVEQILFLDDKIENVAAARSRGWRAEQCLGGEQAAAALRRHGVLGGGRVG